jgi:tellurite methyltransferase
MTDARLDKVHQRWDLWWGDAAVRATWSAPEPAVLETFDGLRARGADRVLDLGAGIGRHALVFAEAGFEVVAVDASAQALETLARTAENQGLPIGTARAGFTELPLSDAGVDHILAWNVLYHGDTDVVVRALGECRRVLRDEGTFQVTMLSKRPRLRRGVRDSPRHLRRYRKCG